MFVCKTRGLLTLSLHLRGTTELCPALLSPPPPSPLRAPQGPHLELARCLSFREQCPLLPVVPCPKTIISYIWPSFPVFWGGKADLISSTPLWLKTEFPRFRFWMIFSLDVKFWVDSFVVSAQHFKGVLPSAAAVISDEKFVDTYAIPPLCAACHFSLLILRSSFRKGTTVVVSKRSGVEPEEIRETS